MKFHKNQSLKITKNSKSYFLVLAINNTKECHVNM